MNDPLKEQVRSFDRSEAFKAVKENYFYKKPHGFKYKNVLLPAIFLITSNSNVFFMSNKRSFILVRTQNFPYVLNE